MNLEKLQHLSIYLFAFYHSHLKTLSKFIESVRKAIKQPKSLKEAVKNLSNKLNSIKFLAEFSAKKVKSLLRITQIKRFI